MLVRLLNENYLKSPTLFEDFKANNIAKNIRYYSEEYFDIKDLSPFPIYMAIKDIDIRNEEYFEAFKIFESEYLDLDGEMVFSERFWHSLYMLNFRKYIIEKYPTVLTNKSDFDTIIAKKFDWENYIYKIVLASKYINYVFPESISDRNKYYGFIIENLDLYNYLIKYRVFRNSNFIINILKIVEDTDTSKLLKEKIKGREDLGDDERYGRRVIFEFNKSYPVVMSPLMDYSSLKGQFLKNLDKYRY